MYKEAVMKNGYIIEAVGLTKKFGDFIAVNHVNFAVNENEAIGIIGPNGAGKTTFMNILTGFYIPEEGHIYFKQKDITKLSPQRRVAMGIVRTFQLVHVFDNLSVFYNVALSCYRKLEGKTFPLNSFFSKLDNKNIKDKVDNTLDIFGLLGKEDQLAGSLPLGSKKKLELAMANIIDPDVLMFDEPFSGLGDQEIDEISSILKTYLHKKTIIMIEHKITKLTKIVDKIAVMCDGKIIAFGSSEETLKHPEVRKSYWKV